MLIKSVLFLFVLTFSCVSYGQDVSYQAVPVQSVISYPAPTVSFVPILVQKEVLLYTWEYRPIVIPNFTIYQYQHVAPVYYHRPCGFGGPGFYYSNSITGPYRY